MAAPGSETQHPEPDAPPAPGTPAEPPGGGPAQPAYRRLYRSPHGRMLGGVAHGLAVHLGVPVRWVRLAFVLLFFAQGIGALLYAAFWFVVPIGIGEPAPGAATQWAYVDGAFVRVGVGGARPAGPVKGRRRGLGRLRELLQGTFHGAPDPAGPGGAAAAPDGAPPPRPPPGARPPIAPRRGVGGAQPPR
ncbi:PspC domain-containing protein, partial [Kitasatospora sp. NPDC059571]|uniref:PspC domain-containing protein n=1 Tax=Kitasatospora sp. NPDC059571 TaxID=3346871 RepID=UPI0036B2032C